MSQSSLRRHLAVLLTVFALAASPLTRGQAMALPNSLELHGGQVLVFKSPRNIERVAVGNGDLIEVTTIDKRQLVVIAGAQKSGFTALHVWYEDGSQRSVDVNVNSADASSASGIIRQMLGPDTGARINDIGGKVVITGELTAVEAQRVGVLTQIYPDVINLTSADPVGMQPMVLMDVRIMEFSRSRLRDLGIRWDNVIEGPTGGAIKDFSSSFYRVLPPGSPFEAIEDVLPGRINPMETYFGIATTIGSKIDILTENGEAYELAAPQLSARSGGSATFLAGGEIPITSIGGFGATSVDGGEEVVYDKLSKRQRLHAVAGENEPGVSRRRVRVLRAGVRHHEVAFVEVPDRAAGPTTLATAADREVAAVDVDVTVVMDDDFARAAGALSLERCITHDHVAHDRHLG